MGLSWQHLLRPGSCVTVTCNEGYGMALKAPRNSGGFGELKHQESSSFSTAEPLHVLHTPLYMIMKYQILNMHKVLPHQ